MVEEYSAGYLSFTLVNNGKQEVYVHTRLQTSKIILSNPNGQHAINRIANLVRAGKINSWNELYHQCGKSVILQNVSAWK